MSDLLQQIKAKAYYARKVRAIGSAEAQMVIRLSDLENILEGVVVVPREPTDAMLSEGHGALCEVHLQGNWGECAGLGWNEARVCYEAMIAAALPQPTLAPDGDGGVE